MKKIILTNLLVTVPLALLFGAQVEAQKALAPKPPSAEPPPVSIAPSPSGAQQVYVYEQKPLAGRQPLVTPQQAQTIIDKFKAAYPKLGSPRLLVYVNRQLVDENSGLKLIARTEKIDTTRSTSGAAGTNGNNSGARTEKAARENRYRLNASPDPSLADRQTTRDVERLFGRPLRMAGASLADQRVATQLMAEKSTGSLSSANDQARKDREALAQIADVAIEVLISSKTVTVAEIAGDRTYSAPDIQATAIRLKDARILGQAATSDLPSKDPRYDVREVTEATALALMEDMLTGVETAAANPK